MIFNLKKNHVNLSLKIDLNIGVNRVVDLCAAPGSWSQVLIKTLSELCDEPPKVIAVDLQKVAEIPGVVHIVGDITSQEVLDAVLDNLDGNKADLVVCDAAPDCMFYYLFVTFLITLTELKSILKKTNPVL